MVTRLGEPVEVFALLPVVEGPAGVRVVMMVLLLPVFALAALALCIPAWFYAVALAVGQWRTVRGWGAVSGMGLLNAAGVVLLPVIPGFMAARSLFDRYSPAPDLLLVRHTGGLAILRVDPFSIFFPQLHPQELLPAGTFELATAGPETFGIGKADLVLTAGGEVRCFAMRGFPESGLKPEDMAFNMKLLLGGANRRQASASSDA